MNSNFLKNASELVHDGTVQIFKGGLRVYRDLLLDDRNNLYILVIRKQNQKKKLDLEKWFREYGKGRKW